MQCSQLACCELARGCSSPLPKGLKVGTAAAQWPLSSRLMCLYFLISTSLGDLCHGYRRCGALNENCPHRLIPRRLIILNVWAPVCRGHRSCGWWSLAGGSVSPGFQVYSHTQPAVLSLLPVRDENETQSFLLPPPPRLPSFDGLLQRHRPRQILPALSAFIQCFNHKSEHRVYQFCSILMTVNSYTSSF